MRVGIDNYGLLPLRLTPLETLEWAVRNGAEGVAFSGIEDRPLNKYSSAFLREITKYASEHQLYLEWGGGQHLSWDISRNMKMDISQMNRYVAEEAAELNVQVVRSCSGGLMRWHSDGPDTLEYLANMGKVLKQLKPVLKDLNVVWAIETHFEFTSFELVRALEAAGFYPGEEVGICLDTMNLLTMLEDPVWAVNRMLPWIVSSHIKDGGVLKYEDGLRSFPAPINEGWINLSEIIRLLSLQEQSINLSIEDHNGSFDLPIHKELFLKEFPDLTKDEMDRLLEVTVLTDPFKKKIENEYFNRTIWPGVCETRMQKNIIELKALKNKILYA
ncbi:MAG: sugar phosphate isomerase/epimerase [Bacteroidales bacterium]|nr:sugar phosphate isomerase/epimerase [Bacteroidales bacterium]